MPEGLDMGLDIQKSVQREHSIQVKSFNKLFIHESSYFLKNEKFKINTCSKNCLQN